MYKITNYIGVKVAYRLSGFSRYLSMLTDKGMLNREKLNPCQPTNN